MASHVALVVAVTSIEIFFSTNEQPQQFTPGDLVFISGKYVIPEVEYEIRNA
ncbi:hypothetical protein C2G38_2185514 [Gigaspora rosea]|uniref:Uncharacterized protein n=1 Tax=Gigaspora rosea TaxID=44941 RepID=A0A397VDM6_9GLOM|nr:hypothetical protein C2G38_2185514 [Gigaspora rosea]